MGLNYTGGISRTEEGLLCQAWTSQTPHKHPFSAARHFPDVNFRTLGNACRNPDNDTVGLWCYTMDPNVRWQRCSVPLCEWVTATLPTLLIPIVSNLISSIRGLRVKRKSTIILPSTTVPLQFRVGVTKPISSVPLFCYFVNILKTHFSCLITRWYSPGVAAAQQRWHLSNINVIQIT